MTPLAQAVAARGITRVCHFTPSRNLAHILVGGRGIVASAFLTQDVRDVFNPTDLARLDGHANHVCCSIEVPNAWYFRTARGKEPIFQDWSVILMASDALLLPGTKFCPRNAAAGFGTLVHEGLGAFDEMYADRVKGAYNRTYRRTAVRNSAIPTDEQAEVLIPDLVPLAMLKGVAVSSDGQARTEIARLKMLRVDPPPFFVAPHFYDAASLSDAIRNGRMPPESPFPCP